MSDAMSGSNIPLSGVIGSQKKHEPPSCDPWERLTLALGIPGATPSEVAHEVDYSFESPLETALEERMRLLVIERSCATTPDRAEYLAKRGATARELLPLGRGIVLLEALRDARDDYIGSPAEVILAASPADAAADFGTASDDSHDDEDMYDCAPRIARRAETRLGTIVAAEPANLDLAALAFVAWLDEHSRMKELLDAMKPPRRRDRLSFY